MLTKNFISLLWTTTENEYDPDVIKDQITAMRDCIEELNARFLERTDIEQMGQKMFDVMKESETRKEENEKFRGDDLEEEELDHLKDADLDEDTGKRTGWATPGRRYL